MNDSDDLWARITALPRPSCIVDFPRKGPDGNAIAQVALWVLTQEDQMASAAAAEETTRRLLKSLPKDGDARQGYDDVYRNAAAVEVLFRAARNPQNLARPFFPSPEEMRRKLSTDEIGVLLDHYLTTQATLGPIIASMTKDETDAFIDQLMRSGERFPLDLLSPAALKTLVTTLVFRLHSLLTASSSPGSPPEKPPSEGTPHDAEK